MRVKGLFGGVIGLAVASTVLSCGSDPPGDGLVVLHIDRAAVGTVVRELQFTVAKVAVFYGTAPVQSILPCTLCDLTGATLPSIPTTTPVRLEFTSTGDTLLGGFSTHPGRISEVRLFVSDVQVTTTDGRVLPGEVVGFHGSPAPKVSCLSPPAGGGGKLDELTVLRLIPGASDDIEVVTDQTTTVVTSIDPNTSFPVLKVADISQPDGSPLHVLKLRINSDYDLRLLPDPTLQPGIFMDQVTVMFKPGTTLADVTALNAQLGATIAIAPILGTAYRMQLPTSIGLQAAFSFYAGQRQVQGVLPAINYAMQDLTPNDGPQPNQSIYNLPAAWQVVQNDLGNVGSRTVRVAVIDVGVDMTHPDLFMNIAINQGEIPASLRGVLQDTDGDGIISFVDLNAPQNAAVKPADSNGNGFIDCKDLLASTTWVDGVDDDGNTLVDDICGWNFIDNTNDASPAVGQEHATMVSGIIGAVGNNGQGIAGDAWAVSIVPIRANAVSTTAGAAAIMPDVSFIDAATYCEKQGIDIANISQGWQIASENANLSCADAKLQTTTGVPQSQYDSALATAQNAFRMPPWTDDAGNPTSRVLYVFSAGNSKLNLADPNIVHVPKELMQAVIPDSILIVGAVKSATMNSDYSDYGAPVVNLWAPGDNWTSLSPGGGTSTGSGTSFASPAVAGVAALVVATATPSIAGNPGEIQSRLIDRAAASVTVNVGCGTAESGRPLLDANASVQP